MINKPEQLTDEQIDNILEMATDTARRYGSKWDSALVGGAGGNFHAITSDTIQAVVVQANDDSRDASWLCDYLESVSPAAIISLLRELQERRKANINPVGYFAYDTDGGFTNHETAERAQKEAQDAIEYFRESACDGWSDEVDSVCWGAIIQQAEKVDERPVTSEDKCASHIECYCDYALLPAGNSATGIGKGE